MSWSSGLTVTLKGSNVDNPADAGDTALSVTIGIDELTPYMEAEDGGADEYDNGLEPNPVCRLRFVVKTVGLTKFSSATNPNTDAMPWVKYLMVQRILLGRKYAWITAAGGRGGVVLPRGGFDDTDDWWGDLLPYSVIRDGALKPSLKDDGTYDWGFELKGRTYFEGNA